MFHGLGRHVERRAERDAGGGQFNLAFFDARLGETEVEHLDKIRHAAALRQEHVGRLDVAMHQTDGVRLGERAADLPQDGNHPAFRLRAVLFHQPVEGQAVEIFHRVIENAFGRAAVIVEGDGVGMGQLAGHLHLPLKSRGAGLVHFFRLQQFHRHRPAHQRMVCAINRAERALANLVVQGVLAELFGLQSRLLAAACSRLARRIST